ncbi:hypothetical protein CQ14_37605 [Bradyrhizobium lablabi]|uniref:Uncharacterized protein n=1 Tax=Bradyrhizobium lablabi TaxID=722472 RepID=A0A0R3MKB5_9BRAD|nr:hypothetical protein [Bradyrhizobium lablabi]KRR17811.1 hypothetical protein CQ14_37605 [Bradyrhizobium lablabi]
MWATFKGEREPRYFPPLDAAPDQFTPGKLRPKRNDCGRIKGSPLWDIKPDLQLFYNTSRNWARMYAPDVISGRGQKTQAIDFAMLYLMPSRIR